MKKRGTWLQAAVRAYQAQTFDHVLRAQRARDDLLAAEQLAGRTDEALHSLSESWAGLRRDAAGSAELDDAYRLFHGFLAGEAREAVEAHQARQVDMDVVALDLQKSHAVQRTLERVARQAAEQRRREMRDKETQDAAEAWLLRRFGHAFGPEGAQSLSAAAAGKAALSDEAKDPVRVAAASNAVGANRAGLDAGPPQADSQGGSLDDSDTR